MDTKKHNWKFFFLKVVLPTLIAIIMFTASFFLILIPSLENNLLDQKRNMLKELTNTAISILSDNLHMAENGKITLAEAKRRSIKQLEKIRYGKNNKDYFWISDFKAQMVMHPYKPELNGTDVSELKDENNVKIFSEFVRIAKDTGDGYLKYMWQWEDNPNRIEPKLSYVKSFEKWNWIIGTGIYLDDVRNEIANLTSKIISISLAIVGVLMVILLHILLQTVTIEKKRFSAELLTVESREKYKALVEASSEGFIMVLENKELLSNATLQKMLGYSAEELSRMSVFDILSGDSDTKAHLDNLTNKQSIPEQFDTQIICSDMTLIDVNVSPSRISFSGKDGYILIFREIRETREFNKNLLEDERDNLIEELKNAIGFFNNNVKNISRKIIEIPIQSTIADGAEIMQKSKVDIGFITLHEEEPQRIGVITDKDLRERAVSRKLDLTSSVTSIMSAPIVAIPSCTPIFEAALKMEEHNLRHLALVDNSGDFSGYITGDDLININNYSAVSLIKSIKVSENTAQLARAKSKLPILLNALLNSGGNINSIQRVTSIVGENIAAKAIKMAIAEIGAAPVEFAFFNVGENGRQEENLDSLQKNALVYNDNEEAILYFKRLTDLISFNLEKSGYKINAESILCNNDDFCMPFSSWISKYRRLISGKEQLTEDLLDIHCVYGKKSLVENLKNLIFTEISENTIFIESLIAKAQTNKPPLNIFGNIVTSSGENNSNTIDISAVIRIVSDITRILAVKNRIYESNTLERLRILKEIKKTFSATEYDDIKICYEQLMQIFFEHQCQSTKRREPFNSRINPEELSAVEKEILKNAFSQIGDYRDKWLNAR